MAKVGGRGTGGWVVMQSYVSREETVGTLNALKLTGSMEKSTVLVPGQMAARRG
jgi:hypothetical protein